MDKLDGWGFLSSAGNDKMSFTSWRDKWVKDKSIFLLLLSFSYFGCNGRTLRPPNQFADVNYLDFWPSLCHAGLVYKKKSNSKWSPVLLMQ